MPTGACRKRIQNASLRAHKGAALAGVGVENCVGCLGLPLPGMHSCAPSRPRPWTELVEITRHVQLEMPGCFLTTIIPYRWMKRQSGKP
jgi:hypothetical protein